MSKLIELSFSVKTIICNFNFTSLSIAKLAPYQANERVSFLPRLHLWDLQYLPSCAKETERSIQKQKFPVAT
jgi:hypothetical protein